jgi:hypothetical protein
MRPERYAPGLSGAIALGVPAFRITSRLGRVITQRGKKTIGSEHENR